MDDLLVVVVRAGHDPFPAALLDAVRDSEVRAILGITFGDGTTTSQQREEIAEALADKRSATLTESALARGIMVALGWLGKRIRAFPHNGLDHALAYLQCTIEIARIEQSVHEAMRIAGWADLSERFAASNDAS